MTEVNQDLVNLVTLFDRMMAAHEQHAQRNALMRSSWRQGAEQSGYKSVEELIPVLADQNSNIPLDAATGMMLTAQIKEYYPGGLLDSSCLRSPDYYEKLMALNLDATPEARFEIRKYRADNVHFGLTVNAYHYLKDRLTYQSGWNVLFYSVFLPEMDELRGKKFKYHEAIEAFPGWLKKHGFSLRNDCDGVGGGYTYNHDNLLSRDFVWDTIYVDYVPDEFQDVLEDGYITFIQIHIGVDARGGFSDPVIYSCDYGFPYDLDMASVGCTECHAWWDYGSYGYNVFSSDDYPRLNELPVYTFEEWQDMLDEQGEPLPVFGPMYPLPGFENVPVKTKEDYDIEKHPIILNEVGEAICPICGKGYLIAQAPYSGG